MACGAAKAATARPASELYIGPYFTDCLAAARAVADDESIRILSALHGLVRLDEVVAPYDMRLPHPAAITAAAVAVQARREGLLDRPATVFGGRRYVDLARHAGWSARAPLSGLGLGHQRRSLREIARTARLPGGELLGRGHPDSAAREFHQGGGAA